MASKNTEKHQHNFVFPIKSKDQWISLTSVLRTFECNVGKCRETHRKLVRDTKR